MRGHVDLVGIVIAIPIGLGIVSLWQGDVWGWALIGIPILVVVLHISRLARKEKRK